MDDVPSSITLDLTVILQPVFCRIHHAVFPCFFTYQGKDIFAWVNILWCTLVILYNAWRQDFQQENVFKLFWGDKNVFLWRLQTGRRKIINQHFVQGHENPHDCVTDLQGKQGFCKSLTLRLISLSLLQSGDKFFIDLKCKARQNHSSVTASPTRHCNGYGQYITSSVTRFSLPYIWLFLL